MSTAYVAESDHGCGFLGGIFHRRVCGKPLKKMMSPDPKPALSHIHHTQGKKSLEVSKLSTSSMSTTSNTPRASQTHDRRLAVYNPNHHNDHNSSTNLVRSKSLVPASSGNITRLGELTLKSPRKSNYRNATPLNPTLGFGNILGRKSSGDKMKVLDGEMLKLMGNEKYKQGKYEEALALYDQAISLDPNQASYRGNKGAALMCLGRILEAVFECREAVLIQPSYQRAHFRLATLYIRLGYAENALYHLKNSGPLAGLKEIEQANALEKCLKRCNEAKRCEEWTALLKETMFALLDGADAAPQVYGLQVEALLNLHRHEEAYAAYKKSPNFNMDSYTKLFGQNDTISIYMIRAHVYLAAGRTKSILLARQRGNNHFQESEFSEACSAYSEGLEQDPYNSVLLSNRAACRSKLGLFEKAIEDCTLALSLQPSYNKARLRRADCNFKLERWEAAIRDYEMLVKEMLGNEEVGRALFEARCFFLRNPKPRPAKITREGAKAFYPLPYPCQLLSPKHDPLPHFDQF
ncbi:hypothetical protein V2J09_008573 [Rumex salicifolius]